MITEQFKWLCCMLRYGYNIYTWEFLLCCNDHMKKKSNNNNNNNKQTYWFNDQNNNSGFFFILPGTFYIFLFIQCKWLTVICKTTWNETTWKSVLCKMKICFKKWWQKVATWMPCCLDRKIRVTNGLCAHCDFFVSMSRDKELALRAVSTSYIFDLQQSIWKSFSLK